MTPVEFIERLSRHHGKRHTSELAQREWMADVLAVLKGTEEHVLDRAYTMIRDEYDERAFPLPATLRKFISRAAETVHPESKAAGNYHYNGPSKRLPPSPEQIAQWKEANEWQHSIMKQYGSWRAYWMATKDTHVGYGQTKPAQAPTIIEQTSDVDWQAGQKPAFEQMQAESKNQHMRSKGGFVKLTDITKRIVGERD